MPLWEQPEKQGVLAAQRPRKNWYFGNLCSQLVYRILGPSEDYPLDLSDLPVAEHEHYLVKHPTDWYLCLKCNATGQHVKEKPCPGHDQRANHEKPEIGETGKTLETLDEEESLLEALLEEELALSQLLEEAMNISMVESAKHVPPTSEELDQENLQQAIQMSFEQLPEKKAEEVSEEQELKEAIRLSMQDPKEHLLVPETSETTARPEAAEEELRQLCSEGCLYNMQCLVNMGYTKEQAIWGVKRANDGNGSLDLALLHCSWRCEADLLEVKRRKLESIAAKPPKNGTPCANLRFYAKCMHATHPQNYNKLHQYDPLS